MAIEWEKLPKNVLQFIDLFPKVDCTYATVNSGVSFGTITSERVLSIHASAPVFTGSGGTFIDNA